MIREIFTENIALYFFSTLAQVWAALVAFAGLAIRDRMIHEAETAREGFLYICVQLLGKCENELRIHSLNGYWHEGNQLISDNEDNLEKFLKSKSYQSKAQPFLQQVESHPYNDLLKRAQDFLYRKDVARKLRARLGGFIIQGLIIIAFSLIGVLVSKVLVQCPIIFSFIAAAFLIASIFPAIQIIKAFTEKSIK